MSAALIEARGVTNILGGAVPVTLVQDINLSIMAREFIAITGPSGSGKSSCTCSDCSIFQPSVTF